MALTEARSPQSVSAYACFVVAVAVLLTPPSLLTAAWSFAPRMETFPAIPPIVAAAFVTFCGPFTGLTGSGTMRGEDAETGGGVDPPPAFVLVQRSLTA